MENEERELVNKVLIKIGRNILVFQQIEKGLKILLPFISPKPSTSGVNNFRKYRQEINSKTLGYIIKIFIDSVDYDHGYFFDSLKKIVDERNKLVHHFGESKGLNILTTQDGCITAINELDSQYKEAIHFYKDVSLFVFGVVAFLRQNYAEASPSIELLYKRLKADIVSDVEYVNLSEPSETTWENTKIVKLLRLAELNTDKIGDMTLLARAGQFIKEQDSNCTPKNYGIKTLKGILKVSGLFDIIESPDGENNNLSVLYKSKVLY